MIYKPTRRDVMRLGAGAAGVVALHAQGFPTPGPGRSGSSGGGGGGGGTTGNAGVLTPTTFGTVRNDFTGRIGGQFRNNTGGPITITAIGRWMLTGNNQSHAVTLRGTHEGSMEWTGYNTIIESVSINMAGGTPGTFRYVDLTTPAVIPNLHYFFVISAESEGGDTWYDANGVVPTATNIVLNPAVYEDNGDPQAGSTNTAFVPTGFLFTV